MVCQKALKFLDQKSVIFLIQQQIQLVTFFANLKIQSSVFPCLIKCPSGWTEQRRCRQQGTAKWMTGLKKLMMKAVANCGSLSRGSPFLHLAQGQLVVSPPTAQSLVPLCSLGKQNVQYYTTFTDSLKYAKHLPTAVPLCTQLSICDVRGHTNQIKTTQ